VSNGVVASLGISQDDALQGGIAVKEGNGTGELDGHASLLTV
jgi:hypothetical protein